MDKARPKYGEHLALSWPVCAHYRDCLGNSPVVQLFGFTTLTAEGAGSIRGWATKMPQGVWHSPKKNLSFLTYTSQPAWPGSYCHSHFSKVQRK